MFRFLIKDSFQQKITTILLVLVIIHVVSVVTSNLINLIRPRLKNFVTMNNSKKRSSAKHLKKHVVSKLKSNTKEMDEKLLEDTKNSYSSDEEFFNTITFQSISNMFDNTVKELSYNSPSKRNYSFTDESFIVDKTVNTYLTPKGKHDSSQAQTNITIHPKLYLDKTCAKVEYTHMLSDNPVEKSASSRSFDSATSYVTVSEKREHRTEDNDNTTIHPKLYLDKTCPKEVNTHKLSDKSVEKSASSRSFDLATSYVTVNEKREHRTEDNDNTTIHPKLYLDKTSSKEVNTHKLSDNSVEKSTSTDSFDSATSYVTFSDQGEHVTEVDNHTAVEVLNNNEKHEQSNELKQTNTVTDGAISNSYHMDKNANLISGITEEHKMLGIAIKEFEKELEPIQDQIQALKNSFNVLERKFSNYSIPSDVSSSDTETLWLTDTFSGTISTTWSETWLD